LKESGIEVLEMDILDQQSCKEAAEAVQEATSETLDILVNNSGVG
jgi:1-acylglycerone phosphate reductase